MGLEPGGIFIHVRYPQSYGSLRPTVTPPPPSSTLRPMVPSGLLYPHAYGTLRPTVPSCLRYPQAYGTLRPTVPSVLRYPQSYHRGLEYSTPLWSYSTLKPTVLPPGGGGGTASLRVGTQNKTTDPRFCATTALSHCPCWFTAPCF